ncbi:MAG: histidinol-phosphatase HisJ family protein [Roseburia sp.]|nr:histidinol-phosphatase HisJ family protein [Roseburia sp.]MCM1099378.1 histidinol-phosphatase HisJ family protein [Ruminococcus flavefaciens]
MTIRADCHLHSSYSGDSDTPMEEMILRGISLGLTSLCFTEHQDFAFPPSPEQPENIFLLDTDAYLRGFTRLKEKYRGKIRLLFGVELGLQPEIAGENAAYARSREFDFIIASSHVCHGKDPYYPSFFQGRSEEDAIREYFTSILENIRLFSDFDVYGHLDYVVRYAPNRDRNYSCESYRELLDDILRLLLEKGKGLELNTGGIQKGLRDFHPCQPILKRYRELGGEIVTLGSDAHDTAQIADCFDRAAAVLKECGFRYYAVFRNRAPEFIRL